MALIEHPFKCDVCSSLKQQSNNWFIGFTDRVLAVPVKDTVGVEHTVVGDSIAITAWDGALALHEKAKHLCGIECVQKFVSLNVQQLH